MGHSLGAAVALETLKDQPEGVASVTGIAPSGFDDKVNPDFIEGFISAEKRKDVKAVLGLLIADPELISVQMVEGVQRFKRLEGAKEALRAIADKNLPARSAGGELPRGFVDKMQVPFLVIWGERDAILDPAAAKRLPSSVEVMSIANVGHMPHLEAASAVNERLARHFNAADDA